MVNAIDNVPAAQKVGYLSNILNRQFDQLEQIAQQNPAQIGGYTAAMKHEVLELCSFVPGFNQSDWNTGTSTQALGGSLPQQGISSMGSSGGASTGGVTATKTSTSSRRAATVGATTAKK